MANAGTPDSGLEETPSEQEYARLVYLGSKHVDPPPQAPGIPACSIGPSLLSGPCVINYFVCGSRLAPASVLEAPQPRKTRDTRSRGREARSRGRRARSQGADEKKHTNDDELMGLIREAMALREKFRLKDENFMDRAKKVLLLSMLCVNRNNRGGNYPNPTTVLNLLISIFTDGFNPSDANHEGVCVQEIPSKERPADSITELEHNINKCKHTPLEECFENDAEAAYSTLSHSHLLMTLLCW